jgi:mgtE-like transporter
MVTAMGDMTTLPSLFLATFLVRNETVTAVAASVAIGVAVVVTVRSYLARDLLVRRIVTEMTATILLTPILDVIAGAFQQARQPKLVAVPILLALIPPFVSQAGALGGIFSSRITSKLRIGVITPSGLPGAPAVLDASIVTGLAVFVFALIGAIAFGLGTLTGLPGMPSAARLIWGAMLAGLIVTPVTIVAGYYLAIVTYRFDLDPDNHGVPIITSVMDLSGVACVLLVMSVSGVLR